MKRSFFLCLMAASVMASAPALAQDSQRPARIVVSFSAGGPLGIAASKRHPVLPDVPTFEEQGLASVDSNNWYGLFVPAKTPDDIVENLSAVVRKAMENHAVKERLNQAGTQPQASTAQEMKRVLDADTAKWGNLIKANDVRPE